MTIRTHAKPTIDAGKTADWGGTSADYAAHRPGPPPEFYKRLKACGIGLAGQSLLDIGTGTGLLAREMAARGVDVSASDISDGQIAAGQRLATEAGLSVDFRVAPAQADIWTPKRFDVVTALQCWWYFDHDAVIETLQKTARPKAKLAICTFSFLPREDDIVAASEALVLEYNPDWTGADWDGVVPYLPDTHPTNLPLIDSFVFDSDIPFTAEGWRGRMRALRGIGASLPSDQVAQFDREHADLLDNIAGDNFHIRHRMDAQIYQLTM